MGKKWGKERGGERKDGRGRNRVTTVFLENLEIGGIMDSRGKAKNLGTAVGFVLSSGKFLPPPAVRNSFQIFCLVFGLYSQGLDGQCWGKSGRFFRVQPGNLSCLESGSLREKVGRNNRAGELGIVGICVMPRRSTGPDFMVLDFRCNACYIRRCAVLVVATVAQRCVSSYFAVCFNVSATVWAPGTGVGARL